MCSNGRRATLGFSHLSTIPVHLFFPLYTQPFFSGYRLTSILSNLRLLFSLLSYQTFSARSVFLNKHSFWNVLLPWLFWFFQYLLVFLHFPGLFPLTKCWCSSSLFFTVFFSTFSLCMIPYIFMLITITKLYFQPYPILPLYI